MFGPVGWGALSSSLSCNYLNQKLICQDLILQTTLPKSASPMEAGVDLQIITTACARWEHLLGISQDISWAFLRAFLGHFVGMSRFKIWNWKHWNIDIWQGSDQHDNDSVCNGGDLELYPNPHINFPITLGLNLAGRFIFSSNLNHSEKIH